MARLQAAGPRHYLAVIRPATMRVVLAVLSAGVCAGLLVPEGPASGRDKFATTPATLPTSSHRTSSHRTSSNPTSSNRTHSHPTNSQPTSSHAASVALPLQATFAPGATVSIANCSMKTAALVYAPLGSAAILLQDGSGCSVQVDKSGDYVVAKDSTHLRCRQLRRPSPPSIEPFRLRCLCCCPGLSWCQTVP